MRHIVAGRHVADVNVPAPAIRKVRDVRAREAERIEDRHAVLARGRGEHGGDLYLRVRLAKHPDFEVDGHNLVHELELAPWEAALGAEIAVPTLITFTTLVLIVAIFDLLGQLRAATASVADFSKISG